jgi:hypothetical protein
MFTTELQWYRAYIYHWVTVTHVLYLPLSYSDTCPIFTTELQWYKAYIYHWVTVTQGLYLPLSYSDTRPMFTTELSGTRKITGNFLPWYRKSNLLGVCSLLQQTAPVEGIPLPLSMLPLFWWKLSLKFACSNTSKGRSNPIMHFEQTLHNKRMKGENHCKQWKQVYALREHCVFSATSLRHATTLSLRR